MAAAMALADARGIARNPSLSTINEERSSQISVYESAVSEASCEDEKADISVSIDGREVSLSLYETPDISEAEARQIAEIYADEISDRLSGNTCLFCLCTYTYDHTYSKFSLMYCNVFNAISKMLHPYFSSRGQSSRTTSSPIHKRNLSKGSTYHGSNGY